jgi:multiple sugar transport system permease protein
MTLRTDTLPKAMAATADEVPVSQRKGTRRKTLGKALLLPGQLISVFVLVVPLLVAFYMSFTDWSPTRGALTSARFIGFFNYEELLVYDVRFVEAVHWSLPQSACR